MTRRYFSAHWLALAAFALAAVPLFSSSAHAQAPSFNQGFETDISGWDAFGGTFDATRVASGTNGVTSSSGNWHAHAGAGGMDASGAAGNWGGYNSTFPDGGYFTSTDVYLDVAAGYANDTRFDLSSAINDPAGSFRRDFVFNCGFYNDADGPGAGTDRFICSASNNATRANAFPKNPARMPTVVASATGWYTFTHRFYDGGSGVLAVDLSVYDDGGNEVMTWTLSDPTDIIGDTVGGNRYGWFVRAEMPDLAFDNTEAGANASPIDVDIAVNTFTNDPMRGESVFFRGPVTNNGASTLFVYVYAEIDVPGLGTFKRNIGGKDLDPGETFKYKDFPKSKNYFPLPNDAPEGTYTVTVYAASDNQGTVIYDQDSFQFTLPPLAAATSASVPTASSLEIAAPTAAPNPFRDATEIRYALSEDAEVDLRVYDALGREVAALVSGSQSAGTHAATLRAGDLPGGVYVWRLAIGGEVTTGRVTLAR